jgi:hypothetical protein
MSLTGKIVERNGALFVLTVDALWTEPSISYCWWRITDREAAWGDFARPEVGDEVTWTRGERWSAVDPKTGRPSGAVFTSGEKPDHFERVSSPSPKVRSGIEVRWEKGRWEKLLKKGWVPA